MENETEKVVESLIKKAGEATAPEAINYTQAALNAAHAMQVLKQK